jgi:lysozyme
MKPRYQVSRAAVDLIKRFEGYRMKAAQLADGRWTLGYGHTLTARAGTSVSEQDAEALLLYDLITVAHAVNENTYTPLNQNQFDALVCFAFNIGTENFIRSGVLRRLNEGSVLQAASAMEMWRKADFEGERIVIDALVRRRAAERALFLTPPDGAWVAVPSSVLRPKVDHDASNLIPSQHPTAVTTSLQGDKAVALREDGSPVPAIPASPLSENAPSASEQAAAAVGARLEAILPDDGAVPAPSLAAPASVPVQDLLLPEPPVLAAAAAPSAFVYATPEPLVVAEPVVAPFQLTPEEPVAEPVFTPHPVAEAPAAVEPSLFETARPATSGSLFNLGGFSTSAEVDLKPQDVAFTDAQPHAFGGVSLLVSLGLLGLALFGGGILWNLSVGANEGLSLIRMFGWAASVIGMICFATSAYLLMRRLGDPELQGED